MATKKATEDAAPTAEAELTPDPEIPFEPLTAEAIGGEPPIDFARVTSLLIQAIEIGGSFNDRQAALCREAWSLLGHEVEAPGKTPTTEVVELDGSINTINSVTDPDGTVRSFG